MSVAAVFARTIRKVVRVGTLPTGNGAHVSVYVEVRYTTGGNLSLSGVVGPRSSGNCYGSCGQIDMGFAHRDAADDDSRYSSPIPAADFTFAPDWSADLWLDLLDVWKRWHLNDWRHEVVPASVLDFLEALPVSDKPYPWG